MENTPNKKTRKRTRRQNGKVQYREQTELREKAGLGSRGTQVPTKEIGLSPTDSSPENTQLPSAQANPTCTHVQCEGRDSEGNRKYMYRMPED